jgi:hypothetical protein
MIKTIVMLLSLALVTAAGAACFGLFGSDENKPAATSCEGLQGQAKIDCEKKQKP